MVVLFQKGYYIALTFSALTRRLSDGSAFRPAIVVISMYMELIRNLLISSLSDSVLSVSR